MKDEALLQRLARLPDEESNEGRAARTRARCHAVLARQRQLRREPARPARPASPARYWQPVVAGLGGLYLTEIARQVLSIYGVI